MPQFWLEVLSRAISGTFASIGKDPADVRFSIIVLAVVTIGVFVRDGSQQGWRGMKSRIASLLTREVGYLCVICLFVFLYNFAREPYRMFDEKNTAFVKANSDVQSIGKQFDSCSGDLKTEQATSKLLGGQVLSQQGLINGQQKATNAQQSTFNLCVTTLTKTNAPVPQSTTMLMMADPPITAKAKHTLLMFLLTNKPVTPVRLGLWCEGNIKSAEVMPFGGSAFAGGITPLNTGSLFRPKVWQINMSFPDWCSAPLQTRHKGPCLK